MNDIITRPTSRHVKSLYRHASATQLLENKTFFSLNFTFLQFPTFRGKFVLAARDSSTSASLSKRGDPSASPQIPPNS